MNYDDEFRESEKSVLGLQIRFFLASCNPLCSYSPSVFLLFSFFLSGMDLYYDKLLTSFVTFLPPPSLSHLFTDYPFLSLIQVSSKDFLLFTFTFSSSHKLEICSNERTTTAREGEYVLCDVSCSTKCMLKESKTSFSQEKKKDLLLFPILVLLGKK